MQKNSRTHRSDSSACRACRSFGGRARCCCRRNAPWVRWSDTAPCRHSASRHCTSRSRPSRPPAAGRTWRPQHPGPHRPAQRRGSSGCSARDWESTGTRHLRKAEEMPVCQMPVFIMWWCRTYVLLSRKGGLCCVRYFECSNSLHNVSVLQIIIKLGVIICCL